MESGASSNELGEEKKSEGNPVDKPVVDEIVGSATTVGQQTLITPEDRLPDGPITDQERQLIFEKGIKFKKKGNYQHALYCLLACVRELKEGSDFPQLPECLHNIAEIYSLLEDYENAVSFAQAEKLYYETSLINVTTESQEGEEQGSKGSANASATGKDTEAKATQPENKDDPQGSSAEARSANEYEKLAHMCLKQKNAQLALEYCGKAVKLRQSIYGGEHPVTKRTLDLFTVIYAEMGKEQYSAAMQKFHETKQPEEAVPEKAADSEPSESAKPGKDTTDEKENETVDSRQSPVGESSEAEQGTGAPSVTDDNDRVGLTPGQAMLCFFLLTVTLAVGVTLLCCHVTGKDTVTTFKYVVTRVKFYYYYYMRRAPFGGKYF